MSTFVKSYGISSPDNVSYVLTFSIPDNCTYKDSYAAGIYTIVVSLKSGQTKPSPIYSQHQLSFTMTGGALNIEFDQRDCENLGVSTKRPIIRLED